ncbi:MAG: LysE family translocator [Deltaproteobacteria bacterium]|uniref:LysE family translocator n=1 Tax=Desulfobacula sp. TaxID=2593537 RepID=UPI0019CD25F6|nr:LysE family translocator [Candidatus Desulfobacula maris]MBL6995510.1 LysE family translocator [Desulfobacula sp.]
MLHYLTIGAILGLSAGITPGPLLTLVISETLAHDIKAGIKVAVVPMITDLPVILITVFIISKLSGFHNILGGISILGGCVILSIGYKGLIFNRVELDLEQKNPNSFIKGILVNALSPHPYLFWFSVGAPTITKAFNHSITAFSLFLISFYFFIVGSKVLLAILTGKSKSYLTGKGYIYTMRFLGFMLCVLSILLFYEGLKLFQIV